MRKFISCLLIVMLVTVFTVPAFAERGVPKLKEASRRFVKAPEVFFDNLNEEYTASEFKPFGFLGGFLKGLFYSTRDVGKSIFDYGTFFIDFEKK